MWVNLRAMPTRLNNQQTLYGVGRFPRRTSELRPLRGGGEKLRAPDKLPHLVMRTNSNDLSYT
ncbi:hypothetical protein LF1_09320 [Rubripirellula obstinata]|uniref:Uncharacterized protein n=1 Tax=Rubripirellula obstinata TaxID=406547 RepID=A0A5B1CFX8_9BACT|nr:hypothetical protein LF1_09320 [Rubripirellula obstinata]